MRKRTSLRRWKARCRIGRVISKRDILDNGLDKFFKFVPAGNPMLDFYRIVP